MQFNNKCTVLLLLASLCARIWAIEVDDETFDDVVLNSGKRTFVDFYASWCVHCKHLRPNWDKLAEKYANNKDVQFVEMDADKNKKHAKQYNIASFPTIIAFNSTSSENPIGYGGPLEFDNLDEFVNDSINPPKKPEEREVVPEPEAPEEPKKEEATNAIIRLNSSLVDSLIAKPKRNAFILFRNEEDESKESAELYKNWEELSIAFAIESNKILIGVARPELASNTTSVQEMFNVTEYPTIVCIIRGNIEKAETYKNSTSVHDLVKFLNAKMNTHRTVDGRLTDDAGIIPELNEYMVAYLRADVYKRKSAVKVLAQRMMKVDSFAYKRELRFYSRIITLLLDDDTSHNIELEKKRLLTAKREPDFEPEIYDDIQMKLNMINYCEKILTGTITNKPAVNTMTKDEL